MHEPMISPTVTDGRRGIGLSPEMHDPSAGRLGKTALRFLDLTHLFERAPEAHEQRAHELFGTLIATRVFKGDEVPSMSGRIVRLEMRHVVGCNGAVVVIGGSIPGSAEKGESIVEPTLELGSSSFHA